MTKYIFPICLFILALAVRLPALGQFLTVDEPDWLDRSRHFAAGLLFSEYACPALDKDGRDFATTGWGCTFHTVHPGVTTMWAGSFGLWGYYAFYIRPTGIDLLTFLTELSARPVDPSLIAALRLPLVLFAAFYVLSFYLISARLISQTVAGTAALLIALDPFQIALSRVLHQDMLTASFMSLAWLLLLGYWLQHKSRRWLILAAICTGLACLSKPIGWFMLGYYVLGVVLMSWRKKTVPSSIDAVIWFSTVGLTFMACFPAMGVMPLAVLSTIFSVSADYATSGHVNGHYFFGAIVDDPGPLFYPLTWLWRTSPIVLLGLLGLFAAPKRALTRHFVLIVILLFLFESLSSKKMDRYFLPAYPLLSLMAAQGLDWLTHKFHGLMALSPRYGAVMLILLQGGLTYFHTPYYFTYYNPLLGSAPVAAQMMTIFGWGEGMDKAADYLNQQPHAESLRVVSGYEDTLATFFKGKIDHTFDTRDQITADYNLYYINQWQRELYNPDVWHYFDRHTQPIQRITLHGLDYVLIYQRPMAQAVPSAGNSLPNTNLFGYTLTSTGQLTLIWQNLGLTEPIWASLTPSQGGETRWTPCNLDPAFTAEAATPAAILASQCNLAASQAPMGLYDLQFGLGQASDIHPSPFAAGRLAIDIDSTGHFATMSLAEAMPRLLQQSLPATARPVDLALGEWVHLVAYEATESQLTLYWQAQRPLNFQELPPILQLRLADTALPLIPPDLAATALQVGQVIALHYPLPAAPPLRACIIADNPDPVGCLEVSP